MKDIYDIIELICPRPAMYIGENRISSLRTFLDGYSLALSTHEINKENNKKVIPFWFFHTWVAKYYNWYESTAGWNNIILKENSGNEERALETFFILFEKFKNIQIVSEQQIEISDKNKEFHFSDECKIKQIVDSDLSKEEPLYKNASKVSLLELSDNAGFVYFVVDNNNKKWEHQLFNNEVSAKKQVELLFGHFLKWQLAK